MKYKQIISGFIVLAVFLTVGNVYAATLDFSPDYSSVAPNNTFDVAVNVEAGTEQVAGTDIYINYDSSFLEVQTVTSGDYFPRVNNVNSTGRLYISGIIETQGDYKTGTGTVATVKFKALQEGSTTLDFDCDISQTDTSKVVQNDVDATNVLDCEALVSHAVTITASAATTTSSSSSTSSSGELPQSGVYEDMVRYAFWGGLMVAFGVGMRVLLRII